MTQTDPDRGAPLAGLRVLDFGHYIAGPLAGVFLADQGAEVIRVTRGDHSGWDHPAQAILARGKRTLQADLKDPDDHRRVLELAGDCDVVIENFRPGVMRRLGLDHEALTAINPAVIYISLPGFSRHDPRHATRAWEGVLSAASGFFTDVSIAGSAVDLPPIFTPLPLPSVYAGLHAATAVLAALYARQATGRGEHVEVPLLDAAMSAAAGMVYGVEDQPARYNAPPVPGWVLDAVAALKVPDRLKRWPLFRTPGGLAPWLAGQVNALQPPLFHNYRCADGGQLFLCAIDNENQIAKLIAVTGIAEEVATLGFKAASCLDVPRSGNNINAYRGTSPRWIRLQRLLADRFATASAGEWEERLAEAGVPAAKQRTTTEWLALPAMRQAGIILAVDHPDGTRTTQPAPQVDLAAPKLRTPVPNGLAAGPGTDGWSTPRAFTPPQGEQVSGSPPGAPPLAGVRVLDLANVIAGPVAGRTLAELGAEVLRVVPVTAKMGPRLTLHFGVEVDQGKRAIALDLAQEEGRAVLRRLVARSDVLVHNSLPQQAERLGLSPDQVHTVNDKIAVCAMTAYSGMRPGVWEHRPAYDPIIQATSGIMSRYGGAGTPVVHGIASTIDYHTGFAAAFGALLALVARQRGHAHLSVRTSLVRTAGWVQLPFVTSALPPKEPSGLRASGWHALDRLYRAKDGWLYVAAPVVDWPRIRAAIGPDAPEALHQAQTYLERRFGRHTVAENVSWAHAVGLGAHEVLSARRMRGQALSGQWAGTLVSPCLPSGRVLKIAHPSGLSFWVPDSTWIRPAVAERYRLGGAPRPGEHSRQILTESGHDEQEIHALLKAGTVAEGWPTGNGYLPA
jgi:crotonobetainyl-CoA:carnitine CoA-transferase CaiB-like acyl-CoA transferase